MFTVQKGYRNCDWKILTTKNGRTMLSSKCNVYSSKKSKFITTQEEKGLLSNFGVRYYTIK